MIIGLSGYAQSGKDSVAKVLVNEYQFERVAFADKIRKLLFEMNPPLPMGVGNETHTVGLQNFVEIYGWDTAKQNPNVRAMLQNLGVGARKVFGSDFWVDEALPLAYMDGYHVVVTDVRFQNEADKIKRMGGQLWRVKRPGVKAVNSHVSEHDLDGYKVDQILNNGGTIEELELLVRQRMDALLANKTN